MTINTNDVPDKPMTQEEKTKLVAVMKQVFPVKEGIQMTDTRKTMEMAVELLDRQWKCSAPWSLEEAQDIAEALREALAQQWEQQPVGWVDDGGIVFWRDRVPPDGVELYAGAAPAVQHGEPQSAIDAAYSAGFVEGERAAICAGAAPAAPPLEYWNAVEGWVSVKPDARTLQKLLQEAYKRTDMIYRDDPDTMFALGFDAGFAAHGIGADK